MDAVINVISNVGFPIAICLVLLWYINKKDEQYLAQLSKIEEEVDQTREQTTEALTKVNEALINNTNVINRNTDLIAQLMSRMDGQQK